MGRNEWLWQTLDMSDMFGFIFELQKFIIISIEEIKLLEHLQILLNFYLPTLEKSKIAPLYTSSNLAWNMLSGRL